MDLPYNWVIVKPFIKAQDPAGGEPPEIPSERVQDIESAFSVEPEKGVLKASMTAQYIITFAPPEVSSLGQHDHTIHYHLSPS